MLTLLLLSAIFILIPISPVFGSTGQATLGTVDSETAPTAYTVATNFVNVSAGTDVAQNDCTALPCNAGFFAIDFNSVGFSGSQFSIYLSTNGLSQVTTNESQDLPYTNYFYVTSLAGAYGPASGNQGFYIGTVGGQKVVVGPIPLQISNSYKYIKIYDGSSTSVAVSIQQLGILPGLSLSPSSGPAGTTVTATGGGFPANTGIVLAYSYSRVWWNGTTKAFSGNWSAMITTPSNGYFTFAKAMVDTQQAINAPTGPFSPVPITISANVWTTGSTLATATFNEQSRFFNSIVTKDQGGTIVDDDNAHVSGQMFGNATGTGLNATVVDLTYRTPGIVTGSGITASILGTIAISGNYSYANTAVTIKVGSTVLGTATTNGNGTWSGTFTVPNLPLGVNHVQVVNNGVMYTFDLFILPTLILTPSSGPISTTVTATAYGFPANSAVYLYWFEHVFADATYYNLFNATVGANGEFNVTVTFVVPLTYGGGHDVSATDTYAANPTSLPGTDIADTTFTVTPSVTVSPTSIDPNTKGFITFSLDGLTPGHYYQVFIDQNIHYDIHAVACTSGLPYCTGTSTTGYDGSGFVNITSTGFRPGIHSFYLKYWGDDYNVSAPVPGTIAYFNVTTNGDYIFAGFAGITASVTSAVNSQLTSISTAIANLQSSVSGISSTLTTLSGQVQSAASSASSAASAAQQAATAAQTAANNTSGIANTSTYVLVVAVLAAIVLVLELAILVRKLS